jgi:hypothetical protein
LNDKYKHKQKEIQTLFEQLSITKQTTTNIEQLNTSTATTLRATNQTQNQTDTTISNQDHSDNNNTIVHPISHFTNVTQVNPTAPTAYLSAQLYNCFQEEPSTDSDKEFVPPADSFTTVTGKRRNRSRTKSNIATSTSPPLAKRTQPINQTSSTTNSTRSKNKNHSSSIKRK